MAKDKPSQTAKAKKAVKVNRPAKTENKLLKLSFGRKGGS
jgi:hypothetical protein